MKSVTNANCKEKKNVGHFLYAEYQNSFCNYIGELKDH